MDAHEKPGRDHRTQSIRLRPELRPGLFVFVDCESSGAFDIPPTEVMASVREPEGLSLVLEKTFADSAGCQYDFVAEWIVLGFESALDLVGLTAIVSSRLADAGISCNVIAGLRHDHLLVPTGSGRRAVELLEKLRI